VSDETGRGKQMRKYYELKGKYALVTGASMGIGNAIALDLAKEGVNLALCALPSEKEILNDFSASLEKNYGIKAWSFAIDLAEPDGPQSLYAETKKCLPHLDILVNCAGTDFYGYFHEMSWDLHDMLLRLNSRAYMALMYLALPEMIERKQGRVLNIVSMAAFQPTPFMAPYGASKVFVQSLSEAVNSELRGTGVIVSTLNPWNVDTALYARMPRDMLLVKSDPLVSTAFIAGKAVDTIKSGRRVCIPTRRARISTVLIRVAPRSLLNHITYMLIRSKSTKRMRQS